jgi:hypothetical protein
MRYFKKKMMFVKRQYKYTVRSLALVQQDKHNATWRQSLLCGGITLGVEGKQSVDTTHLGSFLKQFLTLTKLHRLIGSTG